MDDRKEIIWGLYQDVVEQGRHHETQRLGLTNAVLITAAGALGLVSLDGKITLSDTPAGTFLVALGIVGSVFTLKHYERFRFHMQQARQYRNALGIPELRDLRKKAKQKHKDAWANGWRKALLRTRLHWWWASLHLVISALGAVIFIVALTA